MLMMGNMVTITIMMMVVIFGSVYGLCPRIDHPLKTDQKSPLARKVTVMVKLVIIAARMKNMMIVMVVVMVLACVVEKGVRLQY